MSDAISKVTVRKVSLPLRLIFALKSTFSSIFFSFEYPEHMRRAWKYRESCACRSCSISRIVSERIALETSPRSYGRPSSPRFRTISFLPRTDSYRSAHSRHTAGFIHIAAGGESIFIRPEIDRPRNESPP